MIVRRYDHPEIAVELTGDEYAAIRSRVMSSDALLSRLTASFPTAPGAEFLREAAYDLASFVLGDDAGDTPHTYSWTLSRPESPVDPATWRAMMAEHHGLRADAELRG